MPVAESEKPMTSNQQDPERLLTLQDIADRLGVHIVTVRRWVRSGRLPAFAISRQAGYRVRQGDLDAFLQKTQVGGGDHQDDEGKAAA